MKEDTIAAISTAFGEGGIGIVRMSGEEAGRIFSIVSLPNFRTSRPAAMETKPDMIIPN